MELMWLYSLCQCLLFMSVIVVSVRLCMVVIGNRTVTDIQEQPHGTRPRNGSVSWCLHLCLGGVGAVGGAVEVPVNVLLNLRTPQCLYTCITLVCCPLLIRQFTMFLLVLLTLDTHLQYQLADRYSSVVTHQRALCVVLLCWVASVLSSFAQFIGSDVFDTMKSGGAGPGTAELGLGGNWTTSLPYLTPSLPPRYNHELKVIGNNLPYGGFLSKFYVEDMHNFTYAQIHSSHWGVCAPDIILKPQFLVYVYGMTVFMLPLLCMLAIYIDLLCKKRRKSCFSHIQSPKHDLSRVHFLTLSISLLILLCLPVMIIHIRFLFTPNCNLPAWVHAVAQFLFQMYSLVPQILFTPLQRQTRKEKASFPLSIPNLPPTVSPSRIKSVRMALCEAVQSAPWSSAKHSLKAKVCPEV